MNKPKKMKAGANQKFATKISVAAGSLAALSQATMPANAAIVHVDDRPIELTFDRNANTIDWDVDDEYGRDFYLSLSVVPTSRWLYIRSTWANGLGFVNNHVGGGLRSKEIDNLREGRVVGPTLSSGYFFGPSSRKRELFTGDYTGGTGVLFLDGFSSGVPGFMGFAFDAGGTTLYGWASITMTLSSFGNSSIKIHEWAYEDTGVAIEVGAVPEPHSLALLALGAAGLAAWRTRRGSQAGARGS